MKHNANIEKLQNELGFTGEDLDGKRGPKTDAAILRAADEGRLVVAPALVIIKAPDLTLDGVSVAADPQLTGLHKALQTVIVDASMRSPVPFDVIEGLRTKTRQAQLVKAGASRTHDSRHLTGHAADLWPKDPKTGKNLPSDASFPKGSAAARAADKALWDNLRIIAKVMKESAKERGILLEWGGDWGWDAPHFQLNRVAYPA